MAQHHTVIGKQHDHLYHLRHPWRIGDPDFPDVCDCKQSGLAPLQFMVKKPVTLEQFIAMIPDSQRDKLERDINNLLDEGWGELAIVFVHHAVNGHVVRISRKYNKQEKE